MKLFNKKGFILVETLVVTLFISIVFILVYQNLVPSIGKYQAMVSYDDIDSVYASNLWKQSLLRYGNMDYIDSYLQDHTYLNISDCSDSNIYNNEQYCQKIKKILNILEDDYVFITDYNIHNFRKVVKKDNFFDSGKLSNFRNYIATVSDKDSFYNENDGNAVLVGKYRLFLTRTVTNADQSTSLKYANLGIYTGKYKHYNMGEVVTFAPGTTTGNMNFYVLKNSSSNENTVTLILDRNIGPTTAFNSTNTGGIPNLALAVLKDSTSTWDNVIPFTSSHQYISNGYTISYEGYQARLLEPNDIYETFGNRLQKDYFEKDTLFPIPFHDNSLNFLCNELSNTSGYWMANTVLANSEMAWVVQNEKITPIFISNSSDIGVRPIVVVSKDKLK